MKYVVELKKVMEKTVVIDASSREEADKLALEGKFEYSVEHLVTEDTYGGYEYVSDRETETVIKSEDDLKSYYGVKDMEHFVFKNTDCGCAYETREGCVVVNGYAEGSGDAECEEKVLHFPFAIEEWQETLNQAEKFAEGKTTVLVATDAVGMGLNLPIRRVVFMENAKYDGITRRTLRPEEYAQIAGRAGRYGIYDKGYVISENAEWLSRVSEKKKESRKARISFPSSLLGLDGKLSTIMEQWMHVPTDDVFEKESMEPGDPACPNSGRHDG